MVNEPTATSAAPAAPAPAPAATTPAFPKRQVQAMTVKKSFPGSAAATPLEKAKEYLKDIPVLHARLTAVVSALESTLAMAKKAAADLEKTGADIKVNVARWEEEQRHAGPGHAAPAVPAAAPAPAGGPGAPVADSTIGQAAPGPAGAPGAA